ncbi:hypothetical protein B0A55_09758 [Friedmanniomyces simplex]|uniref:Uncharacterized protein n=1 Tax=Friedmanniomyces simplex TaxID=329884 RepID=A0A4V5NE71_9PEZI|nr:hypothetical protein B0A55_09758 [Friedmanniomyces simplex]
MATPIDLSSLESDPRLFLYTSLTAGSSHIITATSRMETILKANKIPFQAIDTATDEKARKLWQRRAGKRKLPGLVKEGYVIGDLDEIEEWNEFGELKENIGPVPANNAAPPGGQTGVNIAPPLPVNPTATGGTANVSRPLGGVSKAPAPGVDQSKTRPLPGAAASNSKPENNDPTTASVIDDPPKLETMDSGPAEKEKSINAAKEALKAQHPAIDHLSAPASRIHSGSATPAQQAEPKAEAPSVSQEAEEGEGQGGADVEGKEEAGDVVGSTEGEDEQTAAKGVEGLDIGSGEGTKTQEQSAKEGGDAGVSVED